MQMQFSAAKWRRWVTERDAGSEQSVSCMGREEGRGWDGGTVGWWVAGRVGEGGGAQT